VSRNDDLSTGLPEELNGWRSLPERATTYDPETLYDYIDGGAELYLSYGFRRVIHREYQSVREDPSPEVLVDVFDMGESRNAFGVFSQSRETIDSRFGQGSQYTDGLMLFWKGRYYVSILAVPETDASESFVFELAGHIDAAIDSEGQVPAIVDILPAEGLVKESVRYFHHYIWINSHYYISDENLLHIDDKTDAVLATYRSGAGRRYLLVVRYGSEGAAKDAYDSFTAGYLPDLAGGEAVQVEDGTWTGCRARGDMVVVVFNAQTETDAVSLMDAVPGAR
jgi:hypothetical protein